MKKVYKNETFDLKGGVSRDSVLSNQEALESHSMINPFFKKNKIFKDDLEQQMSEYKKTGGQYMKDDQEYQGSFAKPYHHKSIDKNSCIVCHKDIHEHGHKNENICGNVNDSTGIKNIEHFLHDILLLDQEQFDHLQHRFLYDIQQTWSFRNLQSIFLRSGFQDKNLKDTILHLLINYIPKKRKNS